MIQNKLCKDNVLCCDGNCQRCANLIYDEYTKHKEELKAEYLEAKSRQHPNAKRPSGCMRGLEKALSILRVAVSDMEEADSLTEVKHNSLCETETYKNN